MEPRSYQTELVEKAKEKNLIVCLPTGSGKTYIAFLLIKEWLDQLKGEQKKRTVILVKQNELGTQHASRFEGHLDVKIRNFCKGANISLEDRKRWEKEIDEHHILIFIAKTFSNVLAHGILDLNRVNLLIVDECQHTNGQDDYARILKEHYHPLARPPRLLGLTASISAQKIKPEKLIEEARKLAEFYRASIETGSDQSLILRHSTSVKAEYPRCSLCQDKTVSSILKTRISLWIERLEKFAAMKKGPIQIQTALSPIENCDRNQMTLSCPTFDKLKNHFENLIHIGSELGLYGLSLAVKALKTYLTKPNQVPLRIADPDAKRLFEEITNDMQTLIEEKLTDLPTKESSLYSDKVLKLRESLQKMGGGQCIIFVDRIYVAAFLKRVLENLLKDIKIAYIAGTKLQIDELIRLSPTKQREIMENFRKKSFNVLISTAIVEEGIDVPDCSMVIRFNKPQNFSSYMQSKGRARAKDNARFILLRDENNPEEFSKNSEEYRNYEEMEKVLRRNFQNEFDADECSAEENRYERRYRPSTSVSIDGVRAIEIIYQYCAMLNPGQGLSPMFRFDIIHSKAFRCTLTMPANCPIRDDVLCEGRSKKLAKFECCLTMVEKLHRIDELDKNCQPKRPVIETDSDDETDDQESQTGPRAEAYPKQTSYLPLETLPSRAHWHLYRIEQPNNDELAFLTPVRFPKLPPFTLYDRSSSFQVQIQYLKSIPWDRYEKPLEEFSRYIFEKAIAGIHNETMSFDIRQSKIPFLPCLLMRLNSSQSNEIDWKRMETIAHRRATKLNDPSELNETELYYLTHLTPPELVAVDLDPSRAKLASAPWEFKRKAPNIETYADHFEFKVPGIRIRRDFLMCTVKRVIPPRKFYLTPPDEKTKKEKLLIPEDRIEHFPIEFLQHAPWNRTDQRLIFLYPSIFTRLVQLYHLAELEQLCTDALLPMPIFDRDQRLRVDFHDELKVSLKSDVLPLISLNYQTLLAQPKSFPSNFGSLFQATTRRSADERADLENLEILGDCFLKLATSLSLYHQYPTENSGKLTQMKDRKISNNYLHILATTKNLKRFLYADRLILTGKDANWLPPGYISNDGKYTEQRAKRKGFSDMIEALIGAFLVNTNYGTTIQMMHWLGLPTVPQDENGQLLKTPTILFDPSVTLDQIEKFYNEKGFAKVEETLNYRFQNKAYLISALTHASYATNRLTYCYERLEYLGDAVLDFLVVRSIFVEKYDCVTPNHVTNIRQDIANNGRLAHIICQKNIHQHIQYVVDHFFYKIDEYVKNPLIFPTNHLEKDIDPWADYEAPKILADVFEALVGAIFLDCDYSLKRVWQVIDPLLSKYIAGALKHANINPVRFFYEQQGKILEKISNDDGTFSCRVQLPNRDEEIGHGRNIKLARYDACRKALQEFQLNP